MSEQAEKFTPKPWRLLITGKDQRCVTILSSDDTPLASLYFLGSEETYANGYLMAAAPEMYSTLDAILKALETWDVGHSIRGLVLRDMIEEVMKKARGE